MMKGMSWLTNPPTPYHWLAHILCEWDSFVDYRFPAASELISYKKPNKDAYNRHTEIMQTLDLIILDYRVLDVRPRYLAAGIFSRNLRALLIGALETQADMTREFVNSVLGSLPSFLFAAAGITKLAHVDLIIDFLGKVDGFEPTHELPHACKVMSKERLESHYEDFVSY